MCLLFETVKILDQVICNPELHEYRMQKSVKSLLGINVSFNLTELLEIPKSIDKGLYKCRIDYTRSVEKTEFARYQKRKIKSLKIVESDLDYSFKFSDRSRLNKLWQQKAGCDEIIILKNGLLTDTSFSNLCFYHSRKKIWETPAKPLLKGTKRQYYLDRKLIFEQEISPEMLPEYSRLCLINALLDLDEKDSIPLDCIVNG